MYVWRNTEARSCNHCCSRSITYSECAFVALLNQHAMCMRHVIICSLSSYIISFHIISQTTCFSGVGGSGGIIEHTCSDFLYKFSLKHFSFEERIHGDIITYYHILSHMCVGYLVQYPSPLQMLMRLEYSRQIFEKFSNIKLNENLSSGSRVVPCGRTDMAKLIVAFRNFENAPKNSTFCPHSVFMCFVWIWEQTAIISLYSINWLVFITETECLLRGTDWVFIYNSG